MNDAGTEVGPQAKRILDAAIQAAEQYPGVILVVAPGFDPKCPQQTRSYANIMASYIHARDSEIHVVILQAETFDTDGELRAFHQYLTEVDESESCAVWGFWWHLDSRVRMLARRINVRWGEELIYMPVADNQPWFDYIVEPIKRIKVRLPRWFTGPVMKVLHRLRIRTSY